jgi:hypothetical protein
MDSNNELFKNKPPIEFIEFYIERMSNIEKDHLNITKLNFNKHSNLNWGTTILTALYTYLSIKMLSDNLDNNLIPFFISTIIFAFYIIILIIYKHYSIKYEANLNSFIEALRDYIFNLKNANRLIDMVNNSDNVYFETIHSNVENYNKSKHQKQGVIMDISTDNIFNSLKKIEILYKLSMSIFILYIFLLPIYFIYLYLIQYC